MGALRGSGDPAGTNNPDEALQGPNGKPVANQARTRN
jgi:hypothetical protein